MKLDRHIKLTAEVIGKKNIADMFDADDLTRIGQEVKRGYDQDKTSRATWEKRLEAAFNLALQLQEQKTFPWAGCANVKFPLVTIAAIQWHSRAYPLLVQGPEIVKCRINGPDPKGQLRDRADRIAKFMSYQLLDESPTWEEETDRALLQVPIIGCAFKKTYYAGDQGRNVSDLVPARQFVINYWAKSIETAQRKTHVIPMYRNDIYERSVRGIFRDVREDQWYSMPAQPKQTTAQAASDRRTGLTPNNQPDDTTPYMMLEQHVRMDLDGDGYAEPYIITIEENSTDVCRIVCNFDEEDVTYATNREIVRINEIQYFTKIPFIPSPDGSIYDIGFGMLLGPINSAVDSIINQLIDAGTLATTAGGFLGRGAKIRGGDMSFRPFGWNRVDSTGDDLAKSIFPLPVREPSSTLFNLLGLLIEYTNRISGSTDIMVGENPGQNTPAATSQMMVEQGSKINTAIFKRVWRAMNEEFRKLYMLNRKHTPVTVQHFGEESGWITREDFQGPPEAIRPAADPNLVADGQRLQVALQIKQQSAMTPGYDRVAVERHLLAAMKVEDRDTLFPGPDKSPPPPNPKVELEKAKLEAKALSDDKKLKGKLMDILSKRELNLAQIEKLQAEAAAIIAQVGESEAAHELKLFEAQIGAAEKVDQSYREYSKLLLEGMKNGTGTGSGMAR